MGSDPIALPVLELIHAEQPGGFRLEAVFTQPDRPTGRGMHLKPNAIKCWATERGIPVHQPAKCGAADIDFLATSKIDHVLVMAYGQILSRAFLETPPLGVLNLHASLLPRLRGPSPIHTAVALGLKQTGVSLMRIIPKLDAGPVCDVETVPVGDSDSSADVHAMLAGASVPLVRRALPELAAGRLCFTDQDDAKVSYCRIIDKDDSNLDFHATARELADRVRAFQPWPGTRFPFNGIEIRVLDAQASADRVNSTAAGTLLHDPHDGLVVVCGEGKLILRALQRPGGKPLPADEFVRGFAMQDGSCIESRTMRPLEAPVPFPWKRKANSSGTST
jgi:methionyl-tRNA formyltransferase